jgi:hypothetical protein
MAESIVPERNVALHKAVTASSNLSPPAWAVDGSEGTVWNAGAHPIQHITVDLDATYTLSRIELVVEQTPPGRTVHVVKGGTDLSALRELDRIESETASNQTINRIGPWPKIRWLRIETTNSPSWVAWREIRAFAQGSAAADKSEVSLF